MRSRLAALIAGAAVVAGCHSEPTAPGGPSATDAAATLLHVADSLSAHGGSVDEVGAYRGLAALLIGTGRLSSVTISVDGTPSEYLATAQEIQFGGCPPETLCTMVAMAPVRSLVAWEKSNPRRAVQLFTTDFSGTSGFPATGGRGSLVFLDGAGAMYGGNTTSQSISVSLSDTPCMQPDVMHPAVPAPTNCKQAEFTVGLDGTLALVPLRGLLPDSIAAPATPNALPSHRVTMAPQRVHGAHRMLDGICIDTCPTPNPPGLTPPMPMPTRDSLAATLVATVGSDVTFTFTVKNTRGATANVRFNDSQQYDIRVWNDKGTQVWRWGADKAFAQLVSTRTLAPGESISYVEHWKRPATGSYRAMAYLTSASHAAVAFATLSAP